MTVYDNALYQGFVMPILCKDLYEIGVRCESIYQWKCYSKNGTFDAAITLQTAAFDFDKYYVQARQLIDTANPPSHVLPAFSLKDVEKCLPDYLLSYENEVYELSLDKAYGLTSHKATRMPDVFALMLKDALQKRVLQVEHINNVISKLV